jgi:hypothetical protein
VVDMVLAMAAGSRPAAAIVRRVTRPPVTVRLATGRRAIRLRRATVPPTTISGNH